MKIVELINIIENYAAPELQEDYDNSGLITGNPSWDCSGVLCTLDVTVQTLKEAKENHCNLVIAHHPIIFRGLKRINGGSYVEQTLIEAIKNDIAIYSAHTNLDNIVLGVNGMIAKKLGLKNIAILQPKKRMLRRLITFAPIDKAEQVRSSVFGAGAGHIGKYSECSFNSNGTGTFKAREGANPYVGEIGERHHETETKIEIVYPFYLENQVVNALKENHPYEEVAYDIFTMDNVHFGIGAGIIGELADPIEEKNLLKFLKETFDAADVKYHEFFDAEGKLVIADIGHYESEQFTVDLIHDLLAEKFPTFAVLKTRVNTNPVRYFT